MEPGRPSSLQMPAFLHGSFSSVQQKTRTEGRRCAEQYRKDGSFPSPRELWEVPLGEEVVAHEVVDFQHESPAWRLYLVSKVLSGVCEALDWQSTFQVRDAFEGAFRQTAWGALYFAISQPAPMSAKRMALRLQDLLRSWDVLQSARYLFSTPGTALGLEELMKASCDWVLGSWCPPGDASVRTRLKAVAERMAQATKEDSIEAILRQLPLALASARGLKHWSLLSDPAFLRERLATLDPTSFERMSGAYPGELLGQLHDWDHELGVQ